MSRSVDAPLLPSATSVDPSRDTSAGAVCMMFISCASEVAASSLVRFVASPRSIMTFVNPTTSAAFTPSCPAASATAAISACEAGSTFVRSRRPCSSAGSCSSVASVVFTTPAQADSQSIAAFAEKPSPVTIAADPASSTLPVLSNASCLSRSAFATASASAFWRASSSRWAAPCAAARLRNLRSAASCSRSIRFVARETLSAPPS